jgi:predicted RNA-binding Zn-ribbon protein involved in translation (DUF1610 family)
MGQREMVMSDASCSYCGQPIEEDSSTAPRSPCPICGETARTINASVTETISLREYMKTHHKHREGSKVICEEIAGDDYYRKTGTWSIMRRVIDRANNWYEETFRDRDSGDVIHHKAEPLTEHRLPAKARDRQKTES